MRHHIDRKKLLADYLVVSLLVIVPVSTIAYVEGSNWCPLQANLALGISNTSDLPVTNITSQVSLFVTFPLRFNITGLPEKQTNLTVTIYKSGGIGNRSIYSARIEIVYLSPHSTVNIDFKNIYPIARDYSDLNQNDVSVMIWVLSYSIDYSAHFVVFSETPFGVINSGSSYFEFDGKTQSVVTMSNVIYRYGTQLVYYLMFASVIVIIIGLLLLPKSGTARKSYPFATFLVSGASLFLYVFVGSGYDVGILPRYIPVISALVHASFDHIVGNLPLFVIVGVASEYVANAGIMNAKRRLGRFLLFFVLPLVASVGGYGLSGAVEMMAVFVCSYSVINRRTIMRSPWKVAVIFVSGLSLDILYGWITGFALLLPSLSSNELPIDAAIFGEAIYHFYFVALAIIIVVVIWHFRKNSSLLRGV
jgi:hypothetical protein